MATNYENTIKLALIKGLQELRGLNGLYTAIKHIMANEVELIKQNICPYCGKKFSNRRSLMLHLSRGSCSCTMNKAIGQYLRVLTYYRDNFVKKRPDKRIYICTICDYRAKNMSEILIHFVDAHGLKV